MLRESKILFLSCLLLSVRMVAAQPVSLDLYVQMAKASSPLLREYRNNILSASLDSALIRAGYKPQVALVSSNSYAPAIGAFGYDPTLTNGGTFSTLAQVSKQFAGRRYLTAQYRTAGFAADSLRISSIISEADIVRTVTAQFITAYGDQQQLIALEEIHRLLANEETILKKLTQINIYRQTDYLTFLVTLRQQELSLKQTSIQYQTDFAALNYLCGLIDTAALQRTLTVPQMEPQFFGNTFSPAFFRRYTIDSLRLQNDIKLINNSYRPHFSVFGDAGYNTSQLNTLYRNFGVSAGFSMSLPIYDGGRRKLNIQKVSLLEDTRQGYRTFFESQYAQQLAGLRQQLQATESLISDINAQITYSKGLIDVNEKLLQTGDAKIPDFVIAINNYLTAKTLLTQNRISRLQIINQINYWNR